MATMEKGVEVMNIPEGTQTIDLKVSLKVPDYIIHGKTQEEQEDDLLQGAIVQAYLRNEITLMKAGELLGFQSHDEVCTFFIGLNVPTIKNLPDDLEKTQDENRNYLEKQLGI